MSEKQEEFLIWLLKFLGMGFSAPFASNTLNWLTGSEFPSLFKILISITMSMIGGIILYIAFTILKEKKKWEY